MNRAPSDPELPVSTATDLLSPTWGIDDDVITLRAWGSGAAHPLRPDRSDRLEIGTAPACAIRIDDPSRCTSRVHAHLEYMPEHRRWCIADRSKNGLLIDGQPRTKCLLAPGMEIELGRGVILVADSARSLALREALSRALGWGGERAAAVDRALQVVRLAAMRRAILVLCGAGDPAALAEELHRLTLTPARPFVVCNPRRRGGAGPGPERFTQYAPDGRTAVARASGGTVCIYDDRRRPPDVSELLRELQRPTCRTQLVVCAKTPDGATIYNPAPIVIPPLGAREAELERIIEGYAADAARRLELSRFALAPAERSWIRERASATLPEIQTAALRLVAIRRAGTISGGAALLGLSHVAMLRWLESRRFPEGLRPRAARGGGA